jgi:hypothetical protein
MASVDQNEPGRAARLFGAAAALREAIGAPRPPAFRSYHERNLTAVRGRLGKEAFKKTWAEGQEMTAEQAVKYALERPTEPETPVPAASPHTYPAGDRG